MISTNLNKLVFAIVIVASSCTSCKKEEEESEDAAPVSAVFSNNCTGAITLSATTNYVTMRSNGLPNHPSPYWEQTNALYETQTVGQTVNPGSMQAQSFVMVIPSNPSEASSKEETSLGPIGMALNGVAIYNDREGGNVPVDSGTLLSFDRAGAHSGPGGLYHYHFNGDFTSDDDTLLIGWLRDGFPIYGRKCSSTGAYATGLDANGGHTTATTQYPNGIYHYHCSNVNYMNSGFYILKAGSYHGSKGTFTW
ncbi:MAG: YHYH protein [Bacteroidia bacterium]